MFRNLQMYTVHAKPGTDSLLFVREGFNGWAFLLTLPWALYHRLWLASMLILVFATVAANLKSSGVITEASSIALILALQVFAGFQGNDWLRRGLQKRGYATIGITSGDSRWAAERRYFEQYAA